MNCNETVPLITQQAGKTAVNSPNGLRTKISPQSQHSEATCGLMLRLSSLINTQESHCSTHMVCAKQIQEINRDD